MSITDISLKQGFWRAHSEAWKMSGLTQKAYCEQEDISYKSFVYQHNRLTPNQLKNAPINFIKAKPELTEVSQNTGLILILPNGIRLGINGEVNATLLQTVLSVAGGMEC
jgi:hypothetical protein